MCLCNNAVYSIGPCFHHQTHPQLGVFFALAPSLHSLWSYFSTDLQYILTKSLSFSVLSFCFFILLMGVSRQEYWRGLPFPCFVRTLYHDHLSRVAPHGMAHIFTEVDKAVVHVIGFVSFLWLWFSVFLPSDSEGYKAMETPWWERLTEGETGSCSDGQGHDQ